MFFMRKTTRIAERRRGAAGPRHADPDRQDAISSTATSCSRPIPQGLEQAVFGLGCFWGAERKFWELGDGIYVTAVGYAGGHTPEPDL